MKRIGLIGLGIMGSAISASLVRAGYEVIGYDVVAARRREHVREWWPCRTQCLRCWARG